MKLPLLLYAILPSYCCGKPRFMETYRYPSILWTGTNLLVQALIRSLDFVKDKFMNDKWKEDACCENDCSPKLRAMKQVNPRKFQPHEGFLKECLDWKNPDYHGRTALHGELHSIVLCF